MRAILVPVLFLLLPLCSSAQNYILPDGEYMDTLSALPNGCREGNIFYYQVNAKYPESSYDIQQQARLFLLKTKASYTGSGYITFRFTIDCEGKMVKKVQVLQTDEKYRSTHFNQQLVAALYGFLQTMDKWVMATLRNKTPVAYKTFISFKLKDGKIIAVIP